DGAGCGAHVDSWRQTRSLWRVPYGPERSVGGADPYVGAILAAKERGVPVKLGRDVDYELGGEEEARALLDPYPWDYLLGSIHFIGDQAVDGTPRLIDAVGVDAAWEQYFELLGRAARSRLFDSLSHPDLVKIFGHRVDGFDYGPV